MTAAELDAIGRRLFGPHWRAPLARALRVSPRTVQAWSLSERPAPADLAERIADYCYLETRRLDQIARELRAIDRRRPA